MHRIKTPLALLLALAALAIISVPANAITLTNHIVIPHGVTHKAPKHRVVRWHVSLDSDHDGIWNGPDDCDHEAGPRSAGGCKPEPMVATSVSEGVAPSTPTYSSVASTTAGGCPSYMAAEATSPTAVNPTSGAMGCYQVLPSTAAAMGAACSDVNSSACVGAICAAQGNEAWAASGATPCG